MATYSKRSTAPVLPLASAFQRSITPFDWPADGSSAFASSSISSFHSSPSSGYIYIRPTSPPRLNMTTSSVRLTITSRSGSPNRSTTMSPRNQALWKQNGRNLRRNSPKKSCMCSQTTHPGSFRCSLHKKYRSSHSMTSYSPNGLNARRSAMKNSFVRIGTVEGGDLVKRALAALIRPSSHHQRRRSAFQRRPSRLSTVSTADDL